MKRKGWNILEINVGREPEIVLVFGEDERKRPACFPSKSAAKEAQRLINRYRRDSAFLGTTLRRAT